MKRSVILISTFALAALLSGRVGAGDQLDPTGTWQMKVIRPGRPTQESILKLEKAEGKLVGVMSDAQGRSTPVKDAVLKNDELSFRITVAREGREFSFNYKGKLTADTFKGEASIVLFGQKRGGTFEGVRLKGEALLPGYWKFALTLEDGNKIQPLVHLKRDEKEWSGVYIGVSGKELPLQDLKVSQGTVSFHVIDVIDEDKVPLQFSGKLTGDKLDGSVKMGEAKQLLTLKFQGQKIETPTASLTGRWKLSVPYKPNLIFEPVVNFAQTGSALKGTYHGEHGDTALKEGLVIGDDFTFEIYHEKNGNHYRLKYQGKAKANALKGSVEYDFDGVTGFLDFEGTRLDPAEASAAKNAR
jgi:hypothetical protein